MVGCWGLECWEVRIPICSFQASFLHIVVGCSSCFRGFWRLSYTSFESRSSGKILETPKNRAETWNYTGFFNYWTLPFLNILESQMIRLFRPALIPRSGRRCWPRCLGRTIAGKVFDRHPFFAAMEVSPSTKGDFFSALNGIFDGF